MSSFPLDSQLVKEKENFELKSAQFYLKIDDVSYPVRVVDVSTKIGRN